MLPVSSSEPAMMTSTRPRTKAMPVKKTGSVPHVSGFSPEDTEMATMPANAMYDAREERPDEHLPWREVRLADAGRDAGLGDALRGLERHGNAASCSRRRSLRTELPTPTGAEAAPAGGAGARRQAAGAALWASRASMRATTSGSSAAGTAGEYRKPWPSPHPRPLQRGGLRHRLDALGDHVELQRGRHVDDRAHDRAVHAALLELAHEGAVELEPVQRELAQRGQRATGPCRSRRARRRRPWSRSPSARGGRIPGRRRGRTR